MIDRVLLLGSLKDTCRIKRVLWLIVFALLPALLGMLILSAKDIPIGRGEELYNGLTDQMVFGFVLVMIAAVSGTGALAQEIERKTIVYLLTRPVARWRIALWRFVTALLLTAIVAAVSLWLCAGLCFGSSMWHSDIVRRDTGVVLLGALSYTSLFFLLGVAVNRPLIVAVFFAFGWESWVPNMPGSFARISLMSYLRALAPHDSSDALNDGILQMMQQFAKTEILPSTAYWVLWGSAIICIIAMLWIFSKREYCPKDDAA